MSNANNVDVETGYHTKPASDDDDDSTCAICASGTIIFFSWFLVILTFPFSLIACIKVVQEYERAVIFRLGRIKRGGAVGPGLFFILPCTDDIAVCDLRTVSFDVPPQEILTKVNLPLLLCTI